MRTLAVCLSWLHALDDYSRRHSPLHSLHPAAAIAVAAAYLAVVMSFGRYAVSPLLPLALYPIAMLAVSGIPLSAIAKPLLLFQPAILFIGLLNPLLDTQPASVAGFVLARGWLVLASLVIKCALAMSAAMLLGAALGMERFASGLRQMGIPKSFVLQLTLTYRYIWVLLDEAARMATAATLRSGTNRRMRPRNWGALIGSLFLRTYERAERIHEAMRLRGFQGEYRGGDAARFGVRDGIFVAGWLAFFAVARMHDIPLLMGKALTGSIFG